MNVLKNHVEKIIFGVVVIACALFAYSTWQGSESDITEMAGLEENRDKISRQLAKEQVTANYAYGPAAAEKVKYREAFDANLERGTRKVEEEIPPYVAYPTLPRPYVDPTGKPDDPTKLTQEDYAEVPPLGEVKAEGDHGRVFVTFRLPKKMKYMEAVRVEIFRGEDAKKIDLSKPYGAVELGPEENSAAATGAGGQQEKEAGTAVEKATDEGEGGRRRRERREAESKEAPKGREKKEKAPEEIPAEFADLKVFSDTRAEPKKTYYYQVRLIARMSVAVGRRFENRDAAGKLLHVLVVHAPRNPQTVPGAKSGTILYTTPLSEVASATTPDNFQIRLSGYSGKIDPLGTPEYKRSKDYKGRFAVRVWVTEAQAWKEQTLDIAPDEPLKGTLNYKPAGSDENKAYPFDSGYRLVEVKEVETVRETEVEEPQIGPDGNPVMDPDTKKPIMVKRVKKGDPIINEVAVLENVQDKKLEEFPKRADFEARKKSLETIIKLAARQQAERKATQPTTPTKARDRN